uniref:Uncharacterized protein n=1 Tax=Rhizophora mucronata TaxID=61149 RepID=A0A2P2IUR2_RHIMU
MKIQRPKKRWDQLRVKMGKRFHSIVFTKGWDYGYHPTAN